MTNIIVIFLILKQLPNEGRNMPEYASYVVGYTELNDDVKARDYFNRMSTYFNGPFLVNLLVI